MTTGKCAMRSIMSIQRRVCFDHSPLLPGADVPPSAMNDATLSKQAFMSSTSA
jgi:hypothetical protein